MRRFIRSSPAPIVHSDPGDPLDVQYKGTHFLGLDLVNSAVRAMGWSFLASIFSGTGANDNVREGFKLFALGGVAEAGRRLCNWAFERFRLRYCITAHFNEGDPAYEWLINYLTHQDVWRHSREFTVSAKSSMLKWGIKLRSIESAEYVPIYDQPHLFRWRKYWIEIQQKHRQGQAQPQMMFENQPNLGNSLILTIYTLNINILSDLVEEARLRHVEGRRPHVIIHSIDFAFGNVWNVVKRKNRRSLESIILPDDLLSSIVTDVKDFLQTEEWYIKAGIPYRRGYLLYGPPGTGKTSTIYALAGELGLEIYALSLSSGLINDDILQRAASAAPKHSILLLEDIDCAFPSREEEEKPDSQNGVPPWVQQGKVTMSGLLNMLDGVGSEDGKLFFATTNYIDRLDLALIRPGRIDMKVEYKLSTRNQVHSLFCRIYTPQSQSKDSIESLAQSFGSRVPENEFTTAELQGYLLIHRKCPEKAVEGVLRWVEQERAERERRREAAEAEERKKIAKKMDSLRMYGGGSARLMGGPSSASA